MTKELEKLKLSTKDQAARNYLQHVTRVVLFNRTPMSFEEFTKMREIEGGMRYGFFSDTEYVAEQPLGL